MYYYFCASLPALDMGERPPWTVADFLAECRRLLAPGDLQQVRNLLGESAALSAAPFVRDWRAWDTQLRNALARWRAGRAGVDLAGKLRDHPGFDCSLEKDVSDACARPNPLERELALDRLRWRWAERAARQAPFGLPAILAFALQLRIAWRWAELQDEKGRMVVADFAGKLEQSF